MRFHEGIKTVGPVLVLVAVLVGGLGGDAVAFSHRIEIATPLAFWDAGGEGFLAELAAEPSVLTLDLEIRDGVVGEVKLGIEDGGSEAVTTSTWFVDSIAGATLRLDDHVIHLAEPDQGGVAFGGAHPDMVLTALDASSLVYMWTWSRDDAASFEGTDLWSIRLSSGRSPYASPSGAPPGRWMRLEAWGPESSRIGFLAVPEAGSPGLVVGGALALLVLARYGGARRRESAW